MINPPSRPFNKQKYMAGIRMDMSVVSIAVIALFSPPERIIWSNYFVFVKDKFDFYAYDTHLCIFVINLFFKLGIDRSGVFSLPDLKGSAAFGIFIDAIILVIDANFA
jgi:hypothetical protein